MPLRRAVLNVDDLGATHGANRAFLALARAGLASSGSVMAPGPWFREIAEAGAADASLELGVHLTLTSEWRQYRWAPLSTASRASGLIDDDGYFWRDVASLRRHLVVAAAEAEMRAQIERCLAAGLAPTHLDAHMGAAMLGALLPAHLRLAREYGLVPVLPRSIAWAPDPDQYRATIAALDGLAIDHCRGTLAVEADALAPGWRGVLAGLPEGLTHFALHATEPGEFAAIAPDHAGWRFREYEFLRRGGLARMLAAAGIAVTSYRRLAEALPAGPRTR